MHLRTQRSTQGTIYAYFATAFKSHSAFRAALVAAVWRDDLLALPSATQSEACCTDFRIHMSFRRQSAACAHEAIRYIVANTTSSASPHIPAD